MLFFRLGSPRGRAAGGEFIRATRVVRNPRRVGLRSALASVSGDGTLSRDGTGRGVRRRGSVRAAHSAAGEGFAVSCCFCIAAWKSNIGRLPCHARHGAGCGGSAGVSFRERARYRAIGGARPPFTCRTLALSCFSVGGQGSGRSLPKALIGDAQSVAMLVLDVFRAALRWLDSQGRRWICKPEVHVPHFHDGCNTRDAVSHWTYLAARRGDCCSTHMRPASSRGTSSSIVARRFSSTTTSARLGRTVQRVSMLTLREVDRGVGQCLQSEITATPSIHEMPSEAHGAICMQFIPLPQIWYVLVVCVPLLRQPSQSFNGPLPDSRRAAGCRVMRHTAEIAPVFALCKSGIG